MAEDIVSIGIALDTSKVLSGTKQVDTALKQVAAASATTAQATQKMDQAANAAAQALTGESKAAQTAGQSLRQQALAAQDAAQKTTGMKSAADAAASAMGEHLAKAVAAAAQAMIQAQREAKKAEEELRKTEKAAEDAARPFGALGAKIAEMGKTAGGFVLAQVGLSSVAQAFGAVRDAVGGVLDATLKMETLTATFKAISGSSQGASKDLAFLRGTAERLGVSFTGLTQGYTNLTAASQGTSLAGEKTQAIFTAVAEKGRVLGKSADEINGALLAIAQSFSKNTIAAEELRGQFAERMPGAMQEMARAAGMSTQALDKMMQTGGLGIEMWYRWAQSVRSDLGVATDEASKTASSALARLGNDFQKFQVAIGEYVLPPLKDAVDWLHRVSAGALEVLDNLRKTAEARRGLEEAAKAPPRGIAGQSEELGPLNKQIAAIEARRIAVQIGGMNDPLAFANEAEYQRLLERRNVLLGQQTTALQDQKKLRDDALASEVDQPIVVPGAAAQEKVREALKGINAEVEKINRQRAAGLPVEDALNAKIKIYKDALETARKTLAEQPGTFAIIHKSVQPAIDAAQKQLTLAESQKDAIKAAGDAERAGKKEAADAAREEEQARKESFDATMARGKAIYEQDADVVALLDEMQKRTRSLQTTEEERFAARVQAMAEEHPAAKQLLDDELARYSAAKDVNDALRERNKLLGEQAQESARIVHDLDRLHKQLEPSRRRVSTEERLAGTRAEIAARSDNDPARLKAADKQIKETLSTELWDKWKDAGLDALDHVGQALEEFVFKGKLNFKDLLGSIAQDIFRTSMQIIQQQATKKGGWLEMGLNLLSKVPALLGGGGGVPSSTAVTAPAGGLGSEAAWFQHGGEAVAGRPYIVGEAGPELFVPRTPGTVLPHGQGVSSPTVVNVHVSGVQDAQSFVQSRGAVSRAMLGALSQARQQM